MNLERVWWALGVLLVAAAVTVCLVPLPTLAAPFEWNDKFSHIVGHAAMAVYFAGLVPRRGWWKIFAFLVLLGTCIELAQHFMRVGRQGDPRDEFANALGAAFGLVLARLGLARWPDLAAWLLGRRAAQ